MPYTWTNLSRSNQEHSIALKKKYLRFESHVDEPINACITDGSITPEISDQELANIKIVIIDSTSASIEQHHSWVARFHQHPKIQLLLFVSSGFKNEQMGADKNPYGTIRIFAKDKRHLENFLKTIKRQENIGIRSALSHDYRRLHKTTLSNVPGSYESE